MLQIEHAPHLTKGAQQIKLADKISNINDVAFVPPAHWPFERRVDYLAWAEKVVSGLRGCNPRMEELFDETMTRARMRLEAESPEKEAAMQEISVVDQGELTCEHPI